MVLHQACLPDCFSRSVCLHFGSDTPALHPCSMFRATPVRCFYRTLPPRPSEGALVFFTDPDIADPLGDHNMSSFIGAIPFTRQAAGETQDTFEEVGIVSVLLQLS